MTKAEIILDSINPLGCRLTTWILTYPRIVHAEHLRHRMFSLNAASSRSIPSTKIIGSVLTNPFIPDKWPVNGKGMQPKGHIEDVATITKCNEAWLKCRDNAVECTKTLLDLGVHKEIANRVLEPFFYITVLLSGTEFENFFALRAHPNAQAQLQELAYLMLSKYNESDPKPLEPGQWHVPFSDKYCDDLELENQIKVATARAARISYLNFEGKIEHNKDYELHDNLSRDGHFSCFEHSGRCENHNNFSGNFRGWTQYRKMFANESRHDDRVLQKGVKNV